MYESKMNQLGKDIVAWRKTKGFETSWENMPTKLMLVVTEISEAMEAYRKDDKENFSEELADTLIRLLDITGTLGIDIEEEVRKKMFVNEGRPYGHGKVFGDVKNPS